jgi:uncharacterized protein (TIGR02231 family)
MKTSKKIFAAVITMLFVFQYQYTQAAETKIPISTKVEKATVYLQGAQIFRSGNVTLKAGLNNIVFENLESAIQQNSIQYSALGNAVLMDARIYDKYPEEIEMPALEAKNKKLLKLLTDSLTFLKYDLDELKGKMDILSIQRNLLINNRLIKGDTRKDTLNLVKEAFIYLNEKLNSLNADLNKYKKEEVKLNNRIEALQSRITLLQNGNLNKQLTNPAEPNHQLIVSIYAEAPTTATVFVNYFIPNASWTISYDLRAKSANSAMQLTYKAQINQYTGVDWKDVKLTLSSGSPKQNNNKPMLYAWWLNFYQTFYQKDKAESKYLEKPALAAQTTKTLSDSFNGNTESKNIMDFTIEEQRFYDTEYQIQLPCTIPSDGEEHLIPIHSKEISANLQHFAVPKLDKDAFMIARLTDYENLNLFPGNVNIYFDGSFVGQSFLNPNNVNDTLDITMGRDKSIATNRIKAKDKSKDKLLGNDLIKTMSYETTVRNNKNALVTLQLQDQVPLSQNKDIVIETKELSGGTMDETSGLTTWNVKLKPGETKKLTLTYTIKYPKDKAIAGL